MTTRAATRTNAAMAEISNVDILDDAIYRTSTTHFGRAYKSDHKAIRELLKSSLLGCSPYNYIRRFDNIMNGHGAWETLCSFYQRVNFQERMRETAFAKLNSTFYKGETNRFNFEKYVEVDKMAHTILEDCDYNDNTGMDDATKIHHFKSGIKQDAALKNLSLHTRANPAHRTFDGLVLFYLPKLIIRISGGSSFTRHGNDV